MVGNDFNKSAPLTGGERALLDAILSEIRETNPILAAAQGKVIMPEGQVTETDGVQRAITAEKMCKGFSVGVNKDGGITIGLGEIG